MKPERSATTCAVCGDLFDMNRHEKEAGRMPQCAPCTNTVEQAISALKRRNQR
jgi:formylmethanofuran dehydrogenase subunit E